MQRNYTSYTVDNGLSQNTVWDAFQDYKGFMWFGTADGIDRFDGYKMHHYLNSPTDSNSIFGTTGFNFFEDNTGRLIVGHDRGLSIYDRVKDCFKNVYKNPAGISIMGMDEKGILWLTSTAKYIYGFDLNTLQIKHTIFINQSWHNSYGSIISSVKIGETFFIGCANNTIVSFNTKSLAFKIYAFTHNINSTVLSLGDNRFCSIYRGLATIYTISNDSLKYTIKKYNYADSARLYFSGGVLYHNKLYAGGEGGMYVFDTKTLDLEEHLTNFTNVKNDAYHYVQTVRQDKSENLLICTNGGGVYIYSPYKNKFKHYTNYAPKKSLFKAIVTTKNGIIYGGAYDGGITQFMPNGKSNLLMPNIKEPTKTIHSIFKVSEQEMMFTSYFNMFKYNTTSGVFTPIPVDETYYSTSYPYFQKENNQIWLNRNNTTDAAIIDVYTNKKIAEIKNNTITCYKKIGTNTLLIGSKSGLFFYHLETKQIQKTKINGFVKSILIASNDKIYVGTIIGLYVLNMSGEILQHFTTANQLKNNFIYGILEDNNGKLWMSHNKGLSVYNPQTKTFKHYGVKDGLQSNEFNTGAYYKDEKGLLYFGGVNGINVIDPSHIVENKNAPQIAVNEILLGDMPYKCDTAYNEIKSLTLSYLENTLSFDFSALEFSQPESNIYQYRLSGYDNNWIESGTRHFARYANLPPGNYVFQIMAANADGFWNKEPRNIFISIIPPFWQRGWFYWLMGLLGFAAIGGAFYAYNKRQQGKLQRELEVQQKLEQERLRISRDLHDNVGAQLSYLITNVEWMLQHPDRLTEQDEQQRLQAMSEAGRNAILTLRQTIWAISNTNLKVDDFADRFKQFALKMLEFDKSVQVHFTEQILPDKILSPAVALNLFRVCQEAFNNCLKHAKSTNIHIHFQSNEESLFCFVIKDDGVGFDWEQAKQKGHYGLVNMEARAKETNAELKVASEIGNGTTLTITLK